MNLKIILFNLYYVLIGLSIFILSFRLFQDNKRKTIDKGVFSFILFSGLYELLCGVDLIKANSGLFVFHALLIPVILISRKVNWLIVFGLCFCMLIMVLYDFHLKYSLYLFIVNLLVFLYCHKKVINVKFYVNNVFMLTILSFIYLFDIFTIFPMHWINSRYKLDILLIYNVYLILFYIYIIISHVKFRKT